MSEIRGEKVTFRKQDIVVLHSLPSAQAHEPCIVHAPHRRSVIRRIVRSVVLLSILVFAIGAAAMVAIETGMVDGPLNARAQAALNTALGSGYHAEVASTVVRMTGTGSLALKARDVTMVENVSDKRLFTTDSISIELNPWALITGRVAVSRLEADGVILDPALMPQGKPLDLAAIRVGRVSEGLEAVFERMDGISTLIARSETKIVRISDVKLSFAGPRKRIVPVVIDSLDFRRTDDGAMQIDGSAHLDGLPAQLRINAARQGDRIASLTGEMTRLPLSPFLYRAQTATELPFGLESTADFSIKAVRASGDTPPELQLAGKSAGGIFNAGGLTSSVKASEINIAYDFARSTIEILPSMMRVGRSSFPFSGAIVDLDQLGDSVNKGVGIDLLLQSASSAPEDVTETPLVFDAKVEGRFLSDTHELIFSELKVSSALGSAVGSLAMQFGDGSPQLSFALLTDRIQSAAVKQLWPWWMAKTARKWVIGNLFGGTVTDAKIEVFLPKGRISRTVGPIDLNAEELNVRFKIDDARINLAGEIPPLRDAAGAFQLHGERLSVDITGGAAYFQSGRSVNLTGGDFVIPNTYLKPLMAEMKLQVAGQADAIAELVSYRPLEALQKTPFKPEDFSGELTGEVGARFGLVKAQNPPPPQWQAELSLNGVDLNKPMAGRAISDVTGTLRIDRTQAVLKAKAAIDGLPMDVDLVEPVGADSPVERHREISGTLKDGSLAKLAPGLAGIIDGPVSLKVALGENDKQAVTADLSDASISLPWIGWSKGPGIGADVAFDATTEDGVTTISDFHLDGDNFGASGDIQTDKAGLSSANFSAVRLTAGDDYAVTVKRQKAGFGVVVKGNSADIRPVIEALRSPASDDGGDGGSKRISIQASLDVVKGFHDESLSNVNLVYGAKGRQVDALELSAITRSGQAVVAKIVNNGADNVLQLTSGDAGALARFSDIYSSMRGGLLNLSLRDRGANSWRGSVDIRKFALINEARLKSIVSTPSGSGGRSLNQAVKRDIDVSKATFERGFAQLALDPGSVRVDNGIVRGTDIGATFQGTVRDRNGQMDMTGTFMPAYGLNRLFSELPLIGALLGNGRDRGLLGITFKLEGPFNKPKLAINPLSIIAPGVFRNIFEFQ